MAIVFEENDGFAGGFERQGFVFFAVHYRVRDSGVLHAFCRIEHAQFETRGEQAFDGYVELLFGNDMIGYGCCQMGERSGAFQVTAGFDREGARLFGCRYDLMMLVNIIDRAAVGHDIALEPPFFAQDSGQEAAAAAAGFTVQAVVGAHDRISLPLLDAHFKLRQVGFAEVPFVDLCIEEVTFGLGTAMDSKVFHRRDGFEIVWVVALQAFDEPDGEPAGQPGIFTVGLLSPAPAGIAEDIDIGRPEGQSFVDQPFTFAGEIMVFGPGFVRDGRGHAKLHIFIPCGAQPDGLGENRCQSGSGYAMQAFVPPVVFGDTQAGNGRSGIHHLPDLFFQCHAADEVVYALVDGQVGIHEREGGDGVFCVAGWCVPVTGIVQEKDQCEDDEQG